MSRWILVWLCVLLADTACGQTLTYPGSGNGIPNLPCTTGQIPVRTAAGGWTCGTNTSGGAPTSSAYITETDDATLSNDFFMSALTTGLIRNTTTTGVPVIYPGTSCTNQFPRSLNASGAATCASVDLTLDLTGILPRANGGIGSAVDATASGVLVGNGSGFDTRIIPNCSSLTASKLLYDANSRQFACGSDQSNAGTGDVFGSASADDRLVFFTDPDGKHIGDASTLSGLIPSQAYVATFDSTGNTNLAQLSGNGNVVATIGPTLLTPFIIGFDNATHSHANPSQGGQFDLNGASNGTILTRPNGGTGVNTCTGCSGGYTMVGSVGPTFTGDPLAPTAANNDNDTSIATTAFVQTEVHEVGGIGSAELHDTLFSPIACTNCNLNIDQDGRITFASNGLAGSGSGLTQVGSCVTDPCFQTEVQNKVFAAPVGSTGQATMRVLQDADMPATIAGTRITTGIAGTAITTGIVAAARLGSGGTGTNFLRSDGTFATPPGTGTVTSVDMTVPGGGVFAVTGNPITTTGTLAVAATGNSGGIPYFSGTNTIASSAQLTGGRLVLGGGAGGAPTIAGAGTTSTVWHGNAGGAGSYGAIALATEVSGTLGVANGGTGIVSPTNHALIIGSGASAMRNVPVATNGQIFVGVTGADPNWVALAGTAAEVDTTIGAGTLQVGLPDDVTITHNLSVNNLLAVASQADGSNGLDLYNNSTIMQQGSSGHCNAAFVNGRLSKRCNGDTSGTGGLPYGNIAFSGTFALNTTAVTNGTCGTAQTTAVTGLLTTDTILWNPNAAVAAPNGLLTRNVYPTVDTLNVVVCNPTAGSLTPTAMTINYKVIR